MRVLASFNLALDGAAEAKLIVLTLSPAPEGFARWSLRLLEEKVVELQIVERASDNTIGRTLKKHSQTASQAAVGYPAGRQRGLCRQHGGRAGILWEAARSAASARVPRRNLEATDHRDARADPRKAGTQGASRLRIRAQWRRQSVHGVRTAGRVAACESHRPPHRHRLCPYAQGFVGRALSQRGEDRADAGQSQYPQGRLALRSFPRRRGTPDRRALRMALHAQARQLAQHGRIRTRRARVAVSGSPHRRPANPRPRSQRMAGPPQHAPRQGQLAIQNRRRPRQAEETVPSVRVTRATRFTPTTTKPSELTPRALVLRPSPTMPAVAVQRKADWPKSPSLVPTTTPPSAF